MNIRRSRPNQRATPPEPLAAVPGALDTDGGPYVLLECDAGRLWFEQADEVIRPYVERSGTWEPAEGRLLLDLAGENCRLLDIGANVGYFSALISRHRPGVVVDAVEPLPSNATLLSMNMWGNDVDARIWPLALSAGDRFLPLSLAEHNAGDTRTNIARDRKWYTHVAPATRGDDLFGTRGFDLVKLDVQGFELDVLQGLPLTLDRSPGIVVVAEFWPAAIRERGMDPGTVLRTYREMGFEVITQVEEDLRPLEDAEIIAVCDTAGHWGQVNLVLRR